MTNHGANSFEVVTLSDVGLKRSGSPNQDSVGTVLPRLMQKRPPLLIVADGMGGYAGGAQASSLVIEAFKRVYLSHDHAVDSVPVLEEAVIASHTDICQAAKEKPDLDSMGSTVVALVLHPDHIDLVNVGDSRAYLIRAGQLIQISLDQSVVAEMVRRGAMTPEQAQVSPQRNQLLMALSARHDRPEPYSTSIPLQEGDGVLMCSDGLWGLVQHALIQSVVTQMLPQAAAAKLIELANKAGGPDNISVVIAMPKDAIKRMQSRKVLDRNDDTQPSQKTIVNRGRQ